MKKVLVIKGSSRKDSFTNSLFKESLAELQETEITVFDACTENFQFCNGCNYCESNGKCIHRDLDIFFENFEKADVIIFSTPIYNGGFSAPVKALIDRFQVYYTSFYKNRKVQPIKKHRKCILLAAAGRKGDEAFDNMEKNLKCALTILNAELTGSVLCSYTDTAPQYEDALKKFNMILKRSLSDE